MIEIRRHRDTMYFLKDFYSELGPRLSSQPRYQLVVRPERDSLTQISGAHIERVTVEHNTRIGTLSVEVVDFDYVGSCGITAESAGVRDRCTGLSAVDFRAERTSQAFIGRCSSAAARDACISRHSQLRRGCLICLTRQHARDDHADYAAEMSDTSVSDCRPAPD